MEKKEIFELIVILIWFLFWFSTGYIIRCIYCKWKQKHKTKKPCFFWNCKHWQNCPLNFKEDKYCSYYFIVKNNQVINITNTQFKLYFLMSVYRILGNKDINYICVDSDRLYTIFINVSRFPNIPINEIYDFYDMPINKRGDNIDL